MKINDNEIINDVKRVSELLSKPPTKKEYCQHGEYGINTIVRRFGSWNKALEIIVGKINFNTRGENIEKKCAHCNNPITVNKSSEKQNNFCSQSCNAKYNNARMPKRKLKKCCRNCQTPIRANHSFCDNCISNGKHLPGGQKLESKTIKQVLYLNGSNKYGVIRGHAKKVIKDRNYACQKCGYSLHVEACHIAEIHTFPLDTKLSEVNHPDNLLLLCCNCHWEMDNGLWEMVGAVGVEPTTPNL